MICPYLEELSCPNVDEMHFFDDEWCLYCDPESFFDSDENYDNFVYQEDLEK